MSHSLTLPPTKTKHKQRRSSVPEALSCTNRCIVSFYEYPRTNKRIKNSNQKLEISFVAATIYYTPAKQHCWQNRFAMDFPKAVGGWVGDCRSKCTRASPFGTLILQTVRTPQRKEGNPRTTGSRSVHKKVVLLSRSRVGDYRVLGKRRRMDRRVIGGGSGRHIACVGSVQVVNVAKVPHVFVKVNLVMGRG